MLKNLWTFLFAFVLLTEASASEINDYSKTYHKQCATCHGDRGDGKGRAGASLSPMPTDFTSEHSKERLSLDTLIRAIQKGVPGTAMVGYGRRFDEQAVRGLAEYIQTQFMGINKVIVAAAKGVDGKKLYDKHCSACHGDNGNTAVWAKNGLNPPPRNFTSADPHNELTRERMIASVTYGRRGTAMMPFASRLDKDEISSIVAYIRQNFMNVVSAIDTEEGKTEHASTISMSQVSPESPSHGTVDMDLPFSDGFVGNPKAGEKFYQSNCFTCHGRLGNGKGPRSHFNTPRPRDFTSEESRFLFNRPRLFQGISKGKRGTVMPAWSMVLSEQEIANVAEYVFQGFIQPVQKKKSH